MTKTGQAAPQVPREVITSEHGICRRQPLRYERPASPVGSAFRAEDSDRLVEDLRT